MSTIGDMDTPASRLILYEKYSMTAVPGGYRLLSTRVKNNEVDEEDVLLGEKDGYVAFDLFIKNFSGTQYLEELDLNGEEAIYLTVDSEVSVATSGVENTGIENSVRVAFAQIGRVKGDTTTQSVITGITCTSDSTNKVTGLCRTAQIWEPNDTKHVASAISYYNTACLLREGADVNAEGSYIREDEDGDPVTCKTLSNGISYPTYAIRQGIDSSTAVNVYDGEAYNGYEGSATMLKEVDYFTDTEKTVEGVDRPQFMTLAPNSITKVRIYIYIEGQDIDNYSFAEIGKAISVKFGFTKQQLEGDDAGYTGPELLQAPTITLKGDSLIIIEEGTAYEDEGATAVDLQDTDEDPIVTVTGLDDVDTDTVGEYIITYSATDKDGNTATKYRTVKVVAAEEPEQP